MTEQTKDPELVEDEVEDNPLDEDKYDGEAVSFYSFDPEQFELDDDADLDGDANG